MTFVNSRLILIVVHSTGFLTLYVGKGFTNLQYSVLPYSRFCPALQSLSTTERVNYNLITTNDSAVGRVSNPTTTLAKAPSVRYTITSIG